MKTGILSMTKNLRKMDMKKMQLCRKAEEKYFPFGLEDTIPKEWECTFDG
jgi:hypothetical protein